MLHDFTFGDARCAVLVRPRGDGADTTVFLVEDDGIRRRLTTITGHDPDEALPFAALQLERPFGRLPKAHVPADGAW